jgi:hypothetical protein
MKAREKMTGKPSFYGTSIVRNGTLSISCG